MDIEELISYSMGGFTLLCVIFFFILMHKQVWKSAIGDDGEPQFPEIMQLGAGFIFFIACAYKLAINIAVDWDFLLLLLGAAGVGIGAKFIESKQDKPK